MIAIAEEVGRASHEGWRVRKDGRLFWGNTVLTALHNDRNEVTGFSKVTRDLTEIKAAEDALRANALKLEEKNRELEKINQELASFAYVSSHDLQEPLRKIQAFSSSLLETEYSRLSEKGQDYFQRILRSAHRMRMLIEDLLTYSRTTTPERRVSPCNLNQIVQETLSDFRETIESCEAEIELGTLPTINATPFQMGQLFSNIISNALKFRRTDVAPRIGITARQVKGHTIQSPHVDPQAEYHQISVCDNGIGFEPTFGNKIFEIFQRLHNRAEYEGTGVGLAICKKIVENHNGIILAESEQGEGAKFYIYLPA